MIVAIRAQIVELTATLLSTGEEPQLATYEVIVNHDNHHVDPTGKRWNYAQGSRAKYQISKEEFLKLPLGDTFVTTVRLGE